MTPRALAPLSPEGPPEAAANPDALDLDWHPLILLAGLRQERGDPSSWRAAPRRGGLSTAVIDAIMSPRVSSGTVERVVGRFVHRFGDGDLDVLSTSFAELGEERWRAEVGTQHRVVARADAAHKSDVIQRAAALLRERGVLARQDLLTRSHDDDLRAAWCALPGQSSGFTWRHLLLAAGLGEPYVCPLTRRFARRHLGRQAAQAPADELIVVMASAAALAGVGVLDIDHQMWRAAVVPAAPPQPAGP